MKGERQGEETGQGERKRRGYEEVRRGKREWSREKIMGKKVKKWRKVIMKEGEGKDTEKRTSPSYTSMHQQFQVYKSIYRYFGRDLNRKSSTEHHFIGAGSEIKGIILFEYNK